MKQSPAVRNAALAAGAYDAVICTHHAHGGKGAVSSRLTSPTFQLRKKL